MKISNKYFERFERYKQGRMGGYERIRFELELLINPEIKSLYKEYDLMWNVIRIHHRNLMRNKLNKLYHNLMNDLSNKSFSTKIRDLFS